MRRTPTSDSTPTVDDMVLDSRKVGLRLTLTYLLGLGVIVVLLVASHHMNQRALESQLKNADVIDQAGRQRMYSQKITKQLLLLSNPEFEARAQVRETVRADLLAWQDVHEAILAGEMTVDRSAGGSELQLPLSQLDAAYRLLLEDFQAVLTLTESHSSGEIDVQAASLLEHESSYLSAMNAVVGIYSRMASAQLLSQAKNEQSIALLLLFVAIAEAGLVFRPTVLRASTAYARAAEKARSMSIEKARVTRLGETLAAFTKVTSHDLQENLRKIQVYGRIVRDLEPDERDHPEVAEFLDIVVRNAEIVASRIDSLHDLSVVLGSEEQPASCAMEPIILKAWQDVDPKLHKNRVELKIETLQHSMFRAQQLHHLWRALLDNALRYNPEIALKIEIRCTRRGEYIRYEMTDNGHGCNQDRLRQAQRPFSARIEARSSESGYRMGIALATAIADHNGGSVRFHASDSGVRCVIELPAVPAEVIALPRRSNTMRTSVHVA